MKTFIHYLGLFLLLTVLNTSNNTASAQSGKTSIPGGTIKKSDRNTSTYNKVRRLPDGTTIYPDGTVKRPDGTVKFPDGRVKKPNGSIQYPDGTIKYPRDNSKAEKWMPPGQAKKVYGEKSAKSFAPGQQKKIYKNHKDK